MKNTTKAFPLLPLEGREAQETGCSEPLDLLAAAVGWSSYDECRMDSWQYMDEYLYGDRSEDGLFRTVQRKYGLEAVRYDKKNCSIVIKYDPQSADLQEAMPGFDEALDDAGLDSYDAKDAAAREKAAASFDWRDAIIRRLTYDASVYLQEEEEAAKKRREDNERTRTLRAEREHAAEVERVAKLRAMRK